MRLIALKGTLLHNYGSMLIGKHKGINMSTDINGNLVMLYQSIKLLGVINLRLTLGYILSEI